MPGHNQEKLLVSGGRGQMCTSLLQGTGCSTTKHGQPLLDSSRKMPASSCPSLHSLQGWDGAGW